MKQASARQGEQPIQQTSQAFGRFFRQALVRCCPDEFEAQLDALEESAQSELQAELGKTNGNSSLYRAAVAAALTTVRAAKQQRDQQSFTRFDPNETELSAAPQPLAQSVREAIAQLPDKRRRAVRLHLAEMTMAEIGELLGWGESKARQHVERGLQELRKALLASGIEYEIDEL